MSKLYRSFWLALALLILPQLAAAQLLPLKGLSVRLVYPSTDEQETPRTIEIDQTDLGWRLSWYSLGKDLVSENPYPTYKVKTRRGTLEFDGFSGKTGVLHPRLWSEGYFKLNQVLPLWVDKDLLFLKDARESRPFSVGLLNPSQVVLQSAPDEYFEKLNLFQSLYNHFFREGGLARDLNLKKSDEDELKKFQREFFEVHFLAMTDAKLVSNKQPRNVPAHILGNDYYQMTVLGDFQNPLILSLRIFPEKAPKVFRSHFEYFKKKFEYVITQVNY